MVKAKRSRYMGMKIDDENRAFSSRKDRIKLENLFERY